MSKSSITEGNISKALWRFTLPLIAAGLLQQLYSIADTMVLGNFVSGNAVAAVGTTQSIINISIFVILGLMTGFSILLSHLYGAEEHEKIQKLVTSVVIIFSIGIIVAAVGVYFLKDIAFSLMKTPKELIPMASTYLDIACMGMAFSLLYNLYSGILRAVGNSHTPLAALIIASILNVLLDLLFVAVFKWGVGGACFATILAQGISAIYLIMYVRNKMPSFRLVLKKECFDFELIKECIMLSLPKILQAFAMSIGAMFLQSINNSFGVDAIAAITTAYKIDSLAITPIMYINSAISIFTGQNIGAKKHERAVEGLKKGAFMAFMLSLAVTVIVLLFGRFFLSLFGISALSVDIGYRFFVICSIFYPVMAVYNGFLGYLQGAKDVLFVSLVSISAMLIRIGASYLLGGLLGSDVIAAAECISWVFGLLVCAIRFKAIPHNSQLKS